ncbi:hypothetical protein SAMN02745824_0756 [Parasphingorhabdus marina DSM 22363]|uniref:PH domain-containing protein n=1 Tax=Parasphingorhabdus marina DSM 22363 TaxID=1123272 RepID=A0A1N6CQJ0_9SPHN|nr:hypothetical protein [Parasphingorhabdus marina]SIN60851.1 hypothetical protein SAMN02745824_0756 [Parasphingorhabdus marina DSM 22363]
MHSDLGYFDTNCRLSGEKVFGSIGCLNEGNPFPGSLILTNMRLLFLRSSRIGQQSRSIRLKSIRSVSSHLENSYHYILVVRLPAVEHRFELHGQDFATKNAFAQLLQARLLKASHSASDQTSALAGQSARTQTNHA